MGTPLPSAQRKISLPILEIGGLLMILAATLVLVTQLSRFSKDQQKLSPGLTIAEIPVDSLGQAEAQSYIEQVYGQPVTVFYREQEIVLDPTQVGFQVNTEAMLSRANGAGGEGIFWPSFWDYLWRRPEQSYSIELIADYSDEQLQVWLADIAARYDSPPISASPVLNTLSFESGQPGYTLNYEESLKQIDEALRRPTNRVAELVVDADKAPRPGMETLQSLLIEYIVAQEFDGVVSAHAIDLETGEELQFDMDMRNGTPQFLECDVVYAATSTMKLPIMVDYFRYLNWVPTEESDSYKILTDTLWISGNISANFIMQDIGYDDVYAGVESVRNTSQTLGLLNTFIVAPYDDEEPPEYFSTPAREATRAGQCVDTFADPYMQTTVVDLSMILDMMYQCAEFNGGDLIAIFPNEITQEDCEMMLFLLGNNKEGEWLVMSGIPQDVEISHKHGFTYDTHGDAAIVFSPGGDYILSVFVWADVNWLDYEISSHIVEGLSAAAFNYFNPDLINTPRRGSGIGE